MIIKIADFYYETELGAEAAKALVDDILFDHVKEDDELDMDHLLDDIEESEEFESSPDAYEHDVEITLEDLEDRTNEILDEAEDDEEDEEYDDAPEFIDDDEEDEEY